MSIIKTSRKWSKESPKGSIVNDIKKALYEEDGKYKESFDIDRFLKNHAYAERIIIRKNKDIGILNG